MKKIYFLFLLAFIGTASVLHAQDVLVLDTLGTIGSSQNIVVGGSNYHVSESIYLNSEIGAGNFISAGTAIQRVNFLLLVEGIPTTVTSFRIYMKNIPLVTTTLATGVYTTAGYTQVYNGTYNATPVGFPGVALTTPFVRTPGTNLQVLIERFDNVVHTGNTFAAARGNSSGTTVLSSRRYNSTVLPVSGVTSLDASNFRPVINLVHVFPIDAGVEFSAQPNTTCLSNSESITLNVYNAGTTNIAAGAASVTLHVSGANTFAGTLTNSAIILPGASETITFTGVNLSTPGDYLDSAYVTLAGDGTTYNDTSVIGSTTTTTISSFPVSETLEEFYPLGPTSTINVFPYVEALAGANLWRPEHGDYFNDDQTAHLVPRGWPVDSAYYLFDSYSGTTSAGFVSRLFSNCISIPGSATGALLTFWMSHDNTPTLITFLDSIYVSVSTDKGVTWNRLSPGYGRVDPAAATPLWRMESINLAAYVGQTIQIGFEGVSKWGNAIGLDDITITATLPVSLLEFNATRNGAVNKLSWKTSQESNSSRFIIERSTDGTRFTEIGQVAAAGNSNTVRSYNFTDANPAKGFNYYRLRLVDIDNSFKYSVVRNVRNLGSADFSFAPNPVIQQMNLKLDADKSDKGTIIITDISGRQVHSQAVNVISGTNSFFIETANLSPGSYVITVQLSDERVVKKFNKL